MSTDSGSLPAGNPVAQSDPTPEQAIPAALPTQLSTTQADVATHYLDRHGQLRLRSHRPLRYGAVDLEAEVGGRLTWSALRNRLPGRPKSTYARILLLARRFVAQAADLRPDERLAQLRRLRQQIDKWRAKHRSERDGRRAKRAALTRLREAVAEAVEEARFDVLRALQERMPAGVVVCVDGRLSGAAILTHAPRDGTFLAPHWRGQPLDRPLREVIASDLAGARSHLHGTLITARAEHDLCQLDLELPGLAGEPYRTRHHPDADADAHQQTAAIVAHLRRFGGTDAAVGVLSAIFNPGLLATVHHALQTADGAEVSCPFPDAPKASIKAPWGDFRTLTNLGGYHNAVWRLADLPTGDFGIWIDWPLYFDRLGTRDDIEALPLHADGVVCARFHLCLVIDAAAARIGRLDLDLAEPTRVTFSGGLDL